MAEQKSNTPAAGNNPAKKTHVAPVSRFEKPSFMTNKSVQRVSLPDLLKPEDIPVGSWIGGKIVDVKPPLLASQRGALLVLDTEEKAADGAPIQVMLPVTGAIRKAMLPKLLRDVDPEELVKALQPFIGKNFAAQRKESIPNPDPKGRDTFIFDVYVDSGDAAK